MQTKRLTADEIITLNDFPVHNGQILKIFFIIFRKKCSKIIPPCPIMDVSLVLPFFSAKLKNLFLKFRIKNPQAKYFLLDGSHKTTAAALTGSRIPVMILKNNKDIQEAKQMVKIGDLFSLTVANTMKNNAIELKNHFNKKKYFQTVNEKTQIMVKKKVIPRYMIDYYKKHK
ncbi:MAG: hypothetical protein PHW53_03360 [Patescibacteria group bacterium]|nr:hypothetical protein [Patescibacteria group bacterium]